jgi:hypothetical protein
MPSTLADALQPFCRAATERRHLAEQEVVAHLGGLAVVVVPGDAR